MKKEQAYFYQVYKGLTIGFGMYEAIFMAYMADLAERRNRGYVTVYGLKKHLEATGMGRRIFERCVSKTTRMGLLEKSTRRQQVRLRLGYGGISQTGRDRFGHERFRKVACVLRRNVRKAGTAGDVRNR